jgi:hypothetical protein
VFVKTASNKTWMAWTSPAMTESNGWLSVFESQKSLGRRHRDRERSDPNLSPRHWIASQLSLFAMTSLHEFTLPRRERARVVWPTTLKKRAQGMPGASAAPAALCAKDESTQALVTTGTPKHDGIPCAMVLRFPSRSSRGPGFLAPVIGAMDEHRRQLSASVGAPEPHDFAVCGKRSRPARSINRA